MKNSKNNPYKHEEIESKWQAKWEKEGIYQPKLDTANPSAGHSTLRSEPHRSDSKSSGLKTPFYNLMMFPYPSAEGLHIGGVRTFGGVDIYGRFKRMQGHEVFEPFGLDGFGIHAENYAMKIGAHPMEHAKVTEANYYRQMREAGIGVDWSRTVETYKPDYYKWTQWLFLQLFKAGLAYRKKSPVNFCPGCKTVLADEQVIDGQCERCSSIVEKRDLEQWFFRITKYAERLLGNIDSLNWTDKVKLAQRNWIGKKEGMLIKHKVIGMDVDFETFTAYPAWSWADTFIVLAPEHPLVDKLVAGTKYEKSIKDFREESGRISNQERVEDKFEKKGVFTGKYAKDPFGGPNMPIWVANFALMDFGTGIIRCSAHDPRDYEFAQKYDIPLKEIAKRTGDLPVFAHHNKGVFIDSGSFTGKKIEENLVNTVEWIEKEGIGIRKVTYHLRDWLISRQRYWGPPIPMIYCEKCALKKPKILLVHGIYGSGDKNWFPWFKKTMEVKGFEVLTPDLPNSANPTVEAWQVALNKLGVTKNDRLFVVAHSMGSPAACQFIIRNGFEVEKLILVAPTAKEQTDENWKQFSSREGVEACKLFNASNINISELKKLAKERVVYLSDNDLYIPLSVKKTYFELDPRFVEFKNKGHFNEAAGVNQLPEVLSEFPPVDELNLGWHPVPEEQLPVRLPHIKDFKPLGTGKAPLANHPEFYEVTCPVCGSPATRETDVSDTFLDSAWYFLRYLGTEWEDLPFPSVDLAERQNQEARIKKQAKERSRFLPVTMYIGGAEHSVLHLLYARFTTMVLHDLGYLNFEEPFARFYAHGLVIKDGAKMSKSKGNVITPDVYIKKFGADTVRTYLHFMGPFNQDGDFRDSGIEGMNRFLKRVWTILSGRTMISSTTDTPAKRFMHQTIQGVTEDMEELRFNTVIAKLMTWYNFLAKQDEISGEETEVYLKLLAPFAPHMTEELWQQLGNKTSIHTSAWPEFDPNFITKDVVTIAIQVNGKLRSTLMVSVEEAKDQKNIETAAKEDKKVQKFLQEGTIRKTIYIPSKILNFVVA